jgi:methylsterol monooxygenase/4-alpha-methyl-delta7-sterol-4alpha-methyl oxidase
MEILATAIDSWLTFYKDPWFWQFPMATLAISAGAFIFFSIPWTLIAWIEPKSLEKYKIQDKPFELNTFFWPSVGRLFTNNLVMIVLLIASWPIIKFTGVHTEALPAWYIITAQIVFFIFLDDFLYYWMHRYFHENKFLLKHVHSVHHRIRNTCGINGNYMHWIEFTATASLTLLGPILISAHLYVIWIWVVIRQFEAVDGHAGYDIPWNPAHWLPLYQGPVYHDFHHAKFKGNYAGFLPYLDRFMGNTYVADYLKYLKGKRLGMKPLDVAKAIAAKKI